MKCLWPARPYMKHCRTSHGDSVTLKRHLTLIVCSERRATKGRPCGGSEIYRSRGERVATKYQTAME